MSGMDFQGTLGPGTDFPDHQALLPIWAAASTMCPAVIQLEVLPKLKMVEADNEHWSSFSAG